MEIHDNAMDRTEIVDGAGTAGPVQHVRSSIAGDHVVKARAIDVLEIQQRVDEPSVDCTAAVEIDRNTLGRTVVADGVNPATTVQHVRCSIAGDHVVETGAIDVLKVQKGVEG